VSYSFQSGDEEGERKEEKEWWREERDDAEAVGVMHGVAWVF
jgi:hypothetical protein